MIIVRAIRRAKTSIPERVGAARETLGVEWKAHLKHWNVV